MHGTVALNPYFFTDFFVYFYDLFIYFWLTYSIGEGRKAEGEGSLAHDTLFLAFRQCTTANLVVKKIPHIAPLKQLYHVCLIH